MANVLKKIRVIISLIFFIVISFIFVDFTNSLPDAFIRGTLYLQFIPSLVKFLSLFSITTIGFFIVLLLTSLFGRVYCSGICPLGTLQDIIHFFDKRFFRKKKKFTYLGPQPFLRYGIFLFTVLSFLFGSIFLINVLDPYSNFGRILGSIARPAYLFMNNILVYIFEVFDSYAIYPVNIAGVNIISAISSLLVLLVILLFVVKKGRLYCNTVCPVGTLLGVFAKKTLFKFRIIDNACTSCGNCERICKAGCIDAKGKKIDMGRCITCFNCLTVCPHDGIKYTMHTQEIGKKEEEFVSPGQRREFIIKSFSLMAGLTILSNIKIFSQDKGLLPIKRKNPVSPPGARDTKHFVASCTACHLCISVCPTHVLQPSVLEYGLEGILQPYMDYKKSFCNFECNKCCDVCPSGALLPVKKKDKKLVQIGIAHFIKQNCVVHTDGTACGACAEHCPTKAVNMIPYNDGLTIPEVKGEYCIGCGACEYACPVTPHKAIYIEGNPIHLVAKIPQSEIQKEVNIQEDFPF